jgi:hypothetical protein
MNSTYLYGEARKRLDALFQASGFNSVDTGNRVTVVSRHFESGPVAGFGSALTDEDLAIVENRSFNYRIFKPAGASVPATDLILLFHGLNERSWEKYYPWAEKLCVETGKPVLLFPLAFHMDRSPKIFNEKDELFDFYHDRKATEADVKDISALNAVLSSRLETQPERFFTSGYQTYTDVIALIRQIRRGEHLDFAPGAHFDIFAYSIGAFLAEILLLCDPDGLFSTAKLFTFCGGSVLETTNPLSKAIMDSRGVQAILRFFHILQRSPTQASSWQRLEQSIPAKELLYFSSMLGLDSYRTTREKRLSAIGDRIEGIALSHDLVIPPAGVRETLGSRVTEEDFPYKYSHETPFPTLPAQGELVDAAFNQVFDPAVRFLSR